MSQALSTRETRDSAREIKFLIAPDVAARIRDWARPRLAPDPYAIGEAGDDYRTFSIYFDNGSLDVFNRQGSNGRSKYRIRRYGAADVVFLERKMRNASMLVKRRTVVAMADLPKLLDGDVDPGWPGAWFHRRIQARDLQPTAHVSYHRTARVGLGTWGPMRLTLDDQILASRTQDLVFQPAPSTPVLPDRVVLEMKFRVEMPAVFKHLVEEFALQPQSLSKYRLAVPVIGLAEAARPADEGAVAGPRHA
jgi:hypothetical protein